MLIGLLKDEIWNHALIKYFKKCDYCCMEEIKKEINNLLYNTEIPSKALLSYR